jgi:hypothetical protein
MKYYAKKDCGCCTVGPMEFATEATAAAAFAAAGLGNGKSVKDDDGDTWDGIDTFYGYAKSDDEVTQRRLGYLREQIVGTQDP